MSKILKNFMKSLSGRETSKTSDFSDFFEKSSGDKAKVIRQVLREANQEQRKVIDEYKEVVTP